MFAWDPASVVSRASYGCVRLAKHTARDCSWNRKLSVCRCRVLWSETNAFVTKVIVTQVCGMSSRKIRRLVQSEMRTNECDRSYRCLPMPFNSIIIGCGVLLSTSWIFGTRDLWSGCVNARHTCVALEFNFEIRLPQMGAMHQFSCTAYQFFCNFVFFLVWNTRMGSIVMFSARYALTHAECCRQ